MSLTLQQYAEIKDMIIAQYGDKEIRAKTGVGKNTLAKIRQGRWRPSSGQAPTEGAAEDDRSSPLGGVFVRCPGCGHKVQMPCVLCGVSAYKQRLKQNRENAGCPS